MEFKYSGLFLVGVFGLLSACGGGGGGGDNPPIVSSSVSVVVSSVAASVSSASSISSSSALSSSVASSATSSSTVGPQLSLVAGNPYARPEGSKDGVGTLASFEAPAGIAMDSSGNFFISDAGNNTIRKMTPDGVVTTFAGAAGSIGSSDGSGASARFNGPGSIAIDASNNLYVSDTNNHTIRKITSAGVVTTFAGAAGAPGLENGTGAAARFMYPQGLAMGTDGNIYLSDFYNHTIRKITSAGVVTTFVGSALSPGSTDGTGAGAMFNHPVGLTVDGSGNLFVLDSGNHTIRKITTTGVVTTFAGTAGMSGYLDGAGTAALFSTPAGITSDTAGNLYVTELMVVRKITSLGVVTTLTGGSDFGFTDGTGAAAGFKFPYGITTDATGNLIVADTGNNSIRKITPAGVVTTLAGSAVTWGSVDGTGGVARFNIPAGMVSDSGGNLYVADTNNHVIRKITPAGGVTTFAGTAGVSGSIDGAVSEALFNHPIGIVINTNGDFYVTDIDNQNIRKISALGVVTTLAGRVNAGGFSDGVGTAATFGEPSGITIDSAGNLYVTDIAYHTVRKITSTGEVTTLAGAASLVGSADGTGTQARFYVPTGITMSTDGNLYVTDQYNGTIRKVTPEGVVTTFAGTAGSRAPSNGIGSEAHFGSPFGITSDATGNLYVSDYSDKTIRKITTSGAVTTLVGQSGIGGFSPGALPGVIDAQGVTIFGSTLYITSNNAVLKVTPLP